MACLTSRRWQAAGGPAVPTGVSFLERRNNRDEPTTISRDVGCPTGCGLRDPVARNPCRNCSGDCGTSGRGRAPDLGGTGRRGPGPELLLDSHGQGRTTAIKSLPMPGAAWWDMLPTVGERQPAKWRTQRCALPGRRQSAPRAPRMAGWSEVFVPFVALDKELKPKSWRHVEA